MKSLTKTGLDVEENDVDRSFTPRPLTAADDVRNLPSVRIVDLGSHFASTLVTVHPSRAPTSDLPSSTTG